MIRSNARRYIGNKPLQPYGRKDAPPSVGVVHSEGRMHGITPQALVICTATAHKHELQIRRRKLVNPADALAPSTTNLAVSSVHYGTLGFISHEPNQSYRAAPGGDTNVRVVTSANGLSRKENLGMPVILLGSRDMDNEALNDDKVSVQLAGTGAIIHTGLEKIEAGQPCYADPNPATTMVDGELVAAVTIKGISKDTMHFQVRPLKVDTVLVLIKYIVSDIIQSTNVGDAPFAKAIKKGDASEVDTALTTLCNDAFGVSGAGSNIAQDSPLRELVPVLVYADVLLASRIPNSLPGRPSVVFCASLEIVLMRALIKLIRRLYSASSFIKELYTTALPHTTFKPNQQDRSNANIYSNKMLTKLEEVDNLGNKKTALQARLDVDEVRARLMLHVMDLTMLGMQSMEDYFRRFRCGVALNAAHRGDELRLNL